MLARNPRDLGRIIRTRRLAAGMSQDQLAAAIGASRRWVSQVESGHPRAQLALILDALDALGGLVDIVDDPTGLPEQKAGGSR